MTKQSFSPTDRAPKHRPPPESPAAFNQLLAEVMSTAQKIEVGSVGDLPKGRRPIGNLYAAVHEIAYGTIAGQSYETRITRMDSDPTGDTASDLSPIPYRERPTVRSRAASAQRSAFKKLEQAARLMRSADRDLRVPLGLPVRGRPSTKPAEFRDIAS